MDQNVQYYVLDDTAYLAWTEYNPYSYNYLTGSYGETKRFDYSAPFPSDLIRFVHLDCDQIEKLVHRANIELRTLLEKKDPACIDRVRKDIENLRKIHPFFKVTELEWLDRLKKAEEQNLQGLTDLLPRKRISQIGSETNYEQDRIKEIFYRVLDTDLSKMSTQERMKDYYDQCKQEKQRTFEFRELRTQFEQTPQGFAVVLHPKSVFDLVDFSLRLCIQREERMRVCKNCGRYFAIGKSLKAEYCGLFPDEKGRTCRDTGAITAWTKKRENDDVYKNFRREYKKRFARIKAGTMHPDDFYQWSQQARQKKEECDTGAISPEEFAAWLANS